MQHFYLAALVAHILLLGFVTGGFSNFGQRKYGISDTFELKYLGDSDGKSYFVDVNKNMTWPDAKVYCLSSNLKMATIETTAQKRFLKAALQNSAVRTAFWTSARESRLPSMMVWDDSKVQPNRWVHFDYKHGEASTPYHYCGGFIVDGDDNTRMITLPCSIQNYALCESGPENQYIRDVL